MAKKKQEVFKQPIYRGGNRALKQFIAEHLKYPDSALEKKVEGTVTVRYSINHKGVVTEAKVVQGIGAGCDEEAIRLVNLLKYEVPTNRGLRVLFHKTLQIHFRLPKNPKTTVPQQQVTGVRYEVTSSQRAKEADQTPPKPSYSYTIRL